MVFDIHVHTTYGSVCSAMHPTDLILQGKKVGLDGGCVTDHDGMWRADDLHELAEAHDFVFVQGMEVNTEYGEVLVFGLSEYVQGIYSVKRLRQVVDDVGGAIILAHPFRSELSPYYSGWPDRPTLTIEEACSRSIFEFVHAVEVVNGAATQEEIDFIEEVCSRLNLPGTGGSDAHSKEGVGACVTLFEKEITCAEEFLQELRSGRFRPEDRRRREP